MTAREASNAYRARSQRPREPDIQRLLALRHPDPHSILGRHPLADGVVVRAFPPDAEQITLHADEGGSWLWLAPIPAGLFEVHVPNRAEVFPYRLEVRYRTGEVYTLRDPDAFLPSLGDLDLHLVGEGRHEDLYEKLGAHPLRVGEVAGVSFAVWAPARTASASSVISLLGRAPAHDAEPRVVRHFGSSSFQISDPALSTSTRFGRAKAVSSRPILSPSRWSSRRRPPRSYIGPVITGTMRIG